MGVLATKKNDTRLCSLFTFLNENMKLYNILHSTLLEGGRARGRSGVGKKEKEENKLLEKALDNYM